MKIQCDDCTNVFELEPFARKVQGDIEEVGFTCPACHKTTVAYRTNTEIRKLQERVRKARKQVERANATNATRDSQRKAQRNFDKVYAELQEKMAKFNGRVS